MLIQEDIIMANLCSTEKVSIVLPVYNGEKHLKRAIETCLDQTYRNIELIIVDDCSTDNSPLIIKSYDDPRIKSIRHSRNKMLPGALNTGFACSSGHYLTWTSHDNEYLPAALETMVASLKSHGGSCMVYADYWVENEASSGKTLRSLQSPLRLEVDNGVGACFLYTREMYLSVGEYDVSLGLVEDYDYWVRLSRKYDTRHISEPLYLYREHGDSLTSKKRLKIGMLDLILKNNYGYLGDSDLLKAFDSTIRDEWANSSNMADAIKRFSEIHSIVSKNLPSHRRKLDALFIRKVGKFLLKAIFRKFALANT